MPAAKKNIKDIQSLEREIQRLRREAKGLEKKFDDNFTYLQENYGSMTINSLSPVRGVFKSIPQSIFQSILEHEKLRKVLTTFTASLAGKASDGIELLIKKVFKQD